MNRPKIATRSWSNVPMAGLRLLLAWMLLAAPLANAAGTPVFWSVARDGEHLGYLLGTIHSEDARVLEYARPFLDSLTGSRVFAMELMPDLPTLAALAERMQLPEGQDLEQVVGPRRFAAVQEALAAYGVPAAQAQRMQPWAAMMTLSVPPPKTGLFMDFSLSLRASGAGVRVIGLETLDEQLSFLEGMNLDQQLAMLDHAIEESGRAQQVHDELVDIYLAGDLQVLHEHAMEQLQEVDEAARETFLQQGIVLRNRRMLEAAEPHLQGGGAFIAVGSLHLTGETGLLKLLSDSGYDLEPAGWPFIAKP